MATKYNDIITLSKTRTVYNIREEAPSDWKTFIANDQFNKVLDTTIKAVLNNDTEKHKSLWVVGTYGTGKSHAAAVIKHLLCDPIDEIHPPNTDNNACYTGCQCKHEAFTHNLLDDGPRFCAQCTTYANFLRAFLYCNHHDI